MGQNSNKADKSAPFRSGKTPAQNGVVDSDSLSKEQVERSYRRYAPIYDILFGASLGPGRESMTRLVSTLEPRRILEVGVGTGLTLSRYPKNSHITGVDVSEEMLAVAHRRIQPQDSNRIVLHAMDAELMDFPNASFDCVTLPYVLSVTPNPDRLVNEVRRVCRPDGDIVIVNHFSGQSSWRWLESLARPLSSWLGFRSEFSYERNILSHSWKLQSVAPANLFALSRLIHIKNV
ncbi:class I SAM-dependent methyltransferase [Variovorax sp. J22G73]|uniref:class I SAM-dependent methyltransferase n=1 Tax=unclassified Variovorax TaxID=663243 RepID=UPI000D5E926F|nr:MULTISPECIES: class I SAM-dependent methyltransferase [unclassified Variovorax]MDM0009123.1 class I SAM-dependent methyltransferase [Variovorax sp. J22R203]MDM0101630.1 class I SAM-dependent methyltransferase [Variovorax sp. J22G73]